MYRHGTTVHTASLVLFGKSGKDQFLERPTKPNELYDLLQSNSSYDHWNLCSLKNIDQEATKRLNASELASILYILGITSGEQFVWYDDFDI